jgi:hypothetical protein
MAKFDMITWADERYRKECYAINNKYFTVDTAAPDEVYDWVNHNRMMVTYALLNDHVHGFFNVMPLTREAGELFERNSIKEEEITIHHILPPQYMHLAEYLYFPAIAIKDYRSYISHQCTAALMAALTTHLRAIYSMHKLKKIFVNPTTYSGNMMVQKLGLKPLVSFKKPLKGNDLYYAEFNNDLYARLSFFEKRFGEFIGSNCWTDKSYLPKLEATKISSGRK